MTEQETRTHMKTVRVIGLDQIQLSPNRHRIEFKTTKMDELIESIMTFGLLHLPVCRELPNGNVELIAGERRFRAMQIIWEGGQTFLYEDMEMIVGMVPHSLKMDLTPIQVREIELEENAIREDLTWQESADAIRSLHELRQEQSPTHTMADTAEETTGKRTNATHHVRNKVLLSKAMQINPDIAKAASEREALKILKRTLQTDLEAELSLRYTESSTVHTLRTIDAIGGMVECGKEKFDVICTDPPYGIGAQEFDAEMVTIHDYEDDWEKVEPLLKDFAELSFRVAKTQAHLYSFCAIQRFPALRDMLTVQGWEVWPRPFIWHKKFGHIPRRQYGPQYVYEAIVFANKGKKVTIALHPDVIVHDLIRGKDHAAQKPVEVYTNLLRRSCVAGDTILDPFCGSGTIFVAANRLQLTATGFDNDPAAVGSSMRRLESKEQEETEDE